MHAIMVAISLAVVQDVIGDFKMRLIELQIFMLWPYYLSILFYLSISCPPVYINSQAWLYAFVVAWCNDSTYS